MWEIDFEEVEFTKSLYFGSMIVLLICTKNNIKMGHFTIESKYIISNQIQILKQKLYSLKLRNKYMD